MRKQQRFWAAASVLIIVASLSGYDTSRADPNYRQLPNLSGMAWVEDDLFIGIHDAKRNPEQFNLPRVSFLRLPKSEPQGVIWRPLHLKFPGPEGRSSDMESAARIPGGKAFLFAESGQEGPDPRIFYAVYQDGKLQIESYIVWPVAITNVEATAVWGAGDRLVFLYAERADDQPSTKIRWAPLILNPLRIGEFQETTYYTVDPVGPGARPIVALEIDTDGFIYIASACDSGSNDGPYRSVVWRIGQMIIDADGNPRVRLGDDVRVATLDGLKVESIAIRESSEGGKQVYIGTDDEHYGGIIRLLPGH